MKLKRMRFNLRFPDPRGDGSFVTVHSVKELRDCLEDRMIAFDDLIDYFRNGQLHRWLECQDAEEANRAEKIKGLFEDSRGKAVADFAAPLLTALDMETDKEMVDAFVRDYVISLENMMRDKMWALKCSDGYKTKVSCLIDGFRKDKSNLLLMKEDMNALRKYIAQMLKIYGGLSMLEEFHFIEFLKQECPLGALALLTLPEGQKYKDDHLEVFKDFVKLGNSSMRLNGDYVDKTILLNGRNVINSECPYLIQGDNAPIKIYSRKTRKNEWVYLNEKDQQVLVLGASSYWVAKFGETNEELKFCDNKLNGYFRLFNGIEVCSEEYCNNCFLAYIEVPNDGE